MRTTILLTVLLATLLVSGCSWINWMSVKPGHSEVTRTIDETKEGKDESGHFKFKFYPKSMYPHPIPPPRPTTRPPEPIGPVSPGGAL